MDTLFSKSLFLGETYVVYGLGNSGTCAVKALLEMGAIVFAWDDSPNFNSQKWQENLSDKTDSNLTLSPIISLPENAKALILSPGIPHTFPKPHPVALLARKKQIPILSDVELFYQAVRKSGSQARFIAITGTNGKSTCTALLEHILSQENDEVIAGGNIGKSVFSLPRLGDHGIYILEMSSYMLERLKTFKADAAAWTTFSPDHLDRHQNIEGYRLAKRNVFNNMSSPSIAVFGEKANWSIEETEYLKTKNIRSMWAEDFPEKDLPTTPYLPGKHNRQNLALCLFIAQYFGLSKESIEKGARTFEGLPHRLKCIEKINDILFVNDSKATNFEAALPALTAWENIYWILGGIAKANGIEGVEKVASHIKHAFVIGCDAEKLAMTLQKAGIAHTFSKTLEKAVEAAYIKAKENGNGTVLLSPACASQDQFRNFEERGNIFTKICVKIKKSLEITASQDNH
ncbi:UDP-N-acetylmuramoyl-L-alanine--D-glutamate ligase [Acetobacteraceae bacterium]|nr:UDP-N-acetylmuramoyl-L-alanine--D-glutamate ligase [Acetobacteraceae bacterium]